jgi:hypothetical protein
MFRGADTQLDHLVANFEEVGRALQVTAQACQVRQQGQRGAPITEPSEPASLHRVRLLEERDRALLDLLSGERVARRTSRWQHRVLSCWVRECTRVREKRNRLLFTELAAQVQHQAAGMVSAPGGLVSVEELLVRLRECESERDREKAASDQLRLALRSVSTRHWNLAMSPPPSAPAEVADPAM